MIATVGGVSLAACGDDDSDDSGPVGPTTSAPSGIPDTTAGPDEIDAMLARVESYLDAQPDALATSLSALTSTPVSPDQVRAVATSLCESTFAPDVAIGWIESLSIVSAYLMIGPANRLLRLAGSAEICSRPPTPDEQVAYEAGVYGAFGTPLNEIPALSDVPTDTEDTFCQVLDSSVGTAAVESTLGALLSLASRGRIEPGEFLPFAVEVAGTTCERWLPRLNDALREYIDSNNNP